MHSAFGCVVWLALVVLIVASLWKTFEKAGQPGWACLIPIYNLVVMCQVAGKPGWWCILLLIPIVNVVVGIIVAHAVSRRFGYGLGMTLLQIFLPFVAFPILGFGDCAYRPE
jgi:hypothetical protein